MTHEDLNDWYYLESRSVDSSIITRWNCLTLFELGLERDELIDKIDFFSLGNNSDIVSLLTERLVIFDRYYNKRLNEYKNSVEINNG